jgi:hypothetical protein
VCQEDGRIFTYARLFLDGLVALRFWGARNMPRTRSSTARWFTKTLADKASVDVGFHESLRRHVRAVLDYRRFAILDEAPVSDCPFSDVIVSARML